MSRIIKKIVDYPPHTSWFVGKNIAEFAERVIHYVQSLFDQIQEFYNVLENVKDGKDGKDGRDGVDGKDGKDGEKGEQGKQGEKGDKGDKGDIGEVGPRGEKGETGPKGEKGEKGDPGEDGVDGAQGPKGDKGDVGPKGDKGEKGDPGDETMVKVTYGVTTFAEVKALADAGKIPYFYKDVNNGTLEVKFEYSAYIYHQSSAIHSIRFAAPAVNTGNNDVHNYKTLLMYDSTWSTIQDNPPETTYAKATTIIGKENNVYYPTTKAVADYVSGIVGDIDTILDEINGEVI